ncbi:MAG: LytTR family DNA-binding domain-containing protein [Salinivirgaceae bacterium]
MKNTKNTNDKQTNKQAEPKKLFVVNAGLNQFIIHVRNNLGLFLSISFGVFLFVLFFQPFNLDYFEFNNRLIFVAGMATIVFFGMVIIRIIFKSITQKYQHLYPDYELPDYLGSFLMWFIISLALAFYLRYVGFIEITFYCMVKISLIAMAPPIILRFYDNFQELSKQNQRLIKEKQQAETLVEKYQDDYMNQSIEFISENLSENLNLLIKDVAFIKSADNYVEIVYKEADQFKKKLIRNTLKNIELQIRPFSNFNRCHRTSIVNTHFVEKLRKMYNNYWISIKGYSEELPVSRQYLLKLREAL